MDEKDELPPEDVAEMEQNFEQVITELVNDRSLDRFREEYEKLHDALTQSHEHNRVLLEKCRHLNSDIVTNSNKISTVLSMSQNDQRTIANLRKEFEKAWKMVETSQERESRSRYVIDTLREEIQNLTVLVSQTADGHTDQVATMKSTKRDVGSLKEEMKTQKVQVDSMLSDLDTLREKQAVLVGSVNELKKQEDELNGGITQAESEYEELSKTTSELMAEMDKVKESIQNYENDLTIASSRLQDGQAKLDECRKTLSDMDRDRAFFVDENRVVRHRVGELMKLLKKHQKSNQRKLEECEAVRARFNELVSGTQDLVDQEKALTKEIKESKQELEQARKERHDVVTEKKENFQKLNQLRNDVVKVSSDVRKGDLSVRLDSIEIATKDKTSRDLINKQAIEEMKTKDQVKQRVLAERDFADAKKVSHHMKGKVMQVENDQEKYILEAAGKLDLVNQVLEDVEDINRRHEDVKQVLAGKHAEVRRQDTLCEMLKTERDKFCRQLRKWTEENTELQQETGSLSMVISQMKTDIKEIDIEIVDRHIAHCQLLKLVEAREQQVAKLDQKVKQLQADNEERANQIQLLVHQKHEADVDIQQINFKNGHIRAANHLLSQDIDQRNREVEVIREKEKCEKDLLRIGYAHYEKQSGELATYLEQLNQAMEKQKELVFAVRAVESAKKEVSRLSRQLIYVQGQAKALEDEAETPRIIHQLTLLQNVNPELYEMIKLKDSLIEKVYGRLRQVDKLKATKEKLSADSKELAQKLSKAYTGKYREEMETANELLKKKTRQLNRMSSNFSIDPIIEEKNKIEVVKSMIREQKVDMSESKQQISELLYAVRSPREAPPSANPRGKQFCLGGGFAVGNANLGPCEIPRLSFDRSQSDRLRFRKQVPIVVPVSSRVPKPKRICATARTNVMMLSARLPRENL